MYRKKYLLLTVALLCLMTATCAFASPASHTLHLVTEPATGLQLHLYDRGDEYFSFMTDESDHMIEPYGGYFWYVRETQDGLSLSERVTSNEKGAAEALRPSEVTSLQEKMNALRKSLPAVMTIDSSVPQIPSGYHAGTAPNDAGYGRIFDAPTYAIEKPVREATCPLLVLHIQYNNMPAAFDDAAWHQRIFEDGVPDYYTTVSEGAFTYTPATEHYGTANDGVITVTLPIDAPVWARNTPGNQNTFNGIMAGLYHGTDGKDYAIYNESSLFLYALAAAEPSLPDLSAYDRNRDGFISPTEMAFLVVSSGGEASDMGYGLLGLPGVWAHSGAAYDHLNNTSDGRDVAIKLGRVLLYRYTIMGEAVGGIIRPGQSPAWINPVQQQFGTACHELGHDLGLMDLYDTSYSGLSERVGALSLMADGPRTAASSSDEPGSSPTHMDAFSKAYLGFSDPQVIAADGVYTLSAPESATGYSVYRINTDDPDIYYLLENRRYLGYDRGLADEYEDFATRDGGIVIWRIDTDALRRFWEYNRVNANEGMFGIMPVYHDHNTAKPFYGGYDFTDDTLTQSIMLEGTTIKLSFYAESASGMDVLVSLKHQAQPPIITTETLPDGNWGNAYQEPLTAISDLPVTWQLIQGKLPDGLRIVHGTLTGLAAAQGTFTFTVSADNGILPVATKTYTITIHGKTPPVIITDSPDMGYVGEPYEMQLFATGTEPLHWSIVSGQLPQGLTLTTSGVIEGTPEVPENASFVVGVSNGVSPDAQMPLSIETIVIEGVPTITVSSLPVGFAGIPYSYRISTSGTLPIQVSLTSGVLPEGLTLVDGLISGVPTKEENASFTVTAGNALGEDVQRFQLSILPAPTSPKILTETLDDAMLGVTYIQDLEASGGGSFTWHVIGGRLPDGLTMDSEGHIEGTPLEKGIFPFTVEVSNNVLPNDERTFSLSVNSSGSAPVLTDDTLPTGMTGELYEHSFHVTGGGDMVWQCISKLPIGMSFMDGELSGCPTESGTFSITIIVQNGIGPDAVKTFSLRIYNYYCPMKAFVSPRDAGSVLGAGDYYDGDPVTLTAVPNPGYRFVRWMNTDLETEEIYDEYSRENPLSFNIEYGMALTAAFIPVMAIVTQPVDCTALVGEQGVFSVVAEGDQLRYQWEVDRLDGHGWQTLPGTTSQEYRTAAVTNTNNGYRYRCIITDSTGQTVSTEVATLHVAALPPITGDRSHPMLWQIGMLLALSIIILMLRPKHRSSHTHP